MTRREAYEKIAGEAEAMARVARSPKTRDVMKDLARQWRELAETEGRALERPATEAGETGR